MDKSKALKSALPAAFGGLAAALLATTCCILPLVLVILGVGGAWVGNLTALAPYQPAFIAMSLGFVAFGFWRSRKDQVACQPGTLCAVPSFRRATQIMLWLASAIVAAALFVNFALPLAV